MSVVQIRGGVPRVIRETIDTTGRFYRFPFTTMHVTIRNRGGAQLQIYLTEEDFLNDVNFISLPATSASYPDSSWDGPAELCGVWMKTAAATVIAEVIAYQRRA